MIAKIKLHSTSEQQFRFDLIAPNRAVLGSSIPFASRQEALQAICELQAGELQGDCGVDCTGRYVFQFY